MGLHGCIHGVSATSCIYHCGGSQHASTLLMVACGRKNTAAKVNKYWPDQKVLTSDIQNECHTVQNSAANTSSKRHGFDI